MCRSLAVFAGVCCLSILGCSQQREVVVESGKDRLPQSWSPNELAHAAMDEGEVAAEARILIWQIMEDERPLYVESAIVWLRLEGAGRRRWILAHVYRHPRQPQPPPEWRLSVVFDAPHTPRRVFDHAPKNDEIYEFMRDTWWKFAPENGFRLLDASVCAEAWKTVTGQEPTKSYDGVVKE